MNIATLRERLREATEILELIAADRRILEGVPEDDKKRLLKAVTRVNAPDGRTRRRQLKAHARLARIEKVRREESVLHETGIRGAARKPVFTTPNVFPPREFEQADVEDDRDAREPIEPQHCYVCKQHYTRIHHFYDQLCPACGDVQLREAHRARRPARPRRAADRRAREDRLPGRAQAAARGRAADRHDALSARFGGALRAGARLRRVGRPARDLRPRPAPHAERRGVLPRPARDARPPRLHRQQRLPDRAPAAGLLRAHDGRRDGALRTLPEHVRRLLGAYEGLRGSTCCRSGAGGAGAHARRVGLTHAAAVAGAAAAEELPAQRDLFPEGRLDQDLQQVDLRERNSWRLLLAEVSSVELLEVQLVNAVAPFVLNARLKPLMLRTPERDKHIVNVSAVEGQFYRRFKTTRHPHTNMAKAALNMMTRTVRGRLPRRRHPHEQRRHRLGDRRGSGRDRGAQDGRARASTRRSTSSTAPRASSTRSSPASTPATHVWGQFLKDYRPTDW